MDVHNRFWWSSFLNQFFFLFGLLIICLLLTRTQIIFTCQRIALSCCFDSCWCIIFILSHLAATILLLHRLLKSELFCFLLFQFLLLEFRFTNTLFVEIQSLGWYELWWFEVILFLRLGHCPCTILLREEIWWRSVLHIWNVRNQLSWLRLSLSIPNCYFLQLLLLLWFWLCKPIIQRGYTAHLMNITFWIAWEVLLHLVSQNV